MQQATKEPRTKPTQTWHTAENHSSEVIKGLWAAQKFRESIALSSIRKTIVELMQTQFLQKLENFL